MMIGHFRHHSHYHGKGGNQNKTRQQGWDDGNDSKDYFAGLTHFILLLYNNTEEYPECPEES